MLQQHTHMDRVVRLTLYAVIFFVAISTTSANTVSIDRDYEITNQNGLYNIGVMPLRNIWNGTNWTRVNTTIGISTDPLYDYSVEGNNKYYTAYFAENPSFGQTVKFVRNNTEITYQPAALNWKNNIDQIQQISNIQSVIGSPDTNEFIYPNAYGTGTSLQYRYTPSELKLNLILDNETSIANPQQFIIDGGNPYLELNFIIDTDAPRIEVEGLEWDRRTTTTTTEPVIITDTNGNELYRIPRPVTVDSTGDEYLGSLELKRQGGSLYISMDGGSYDWLQNATYPVYIDPTTEINVSEDIEINLTDDPAFEPLIKITLYNVTDDGVRSNVLILDPIPIDQIGAEDYAIDPENVAFDYGVVDVTNAQGDYLYKCLSWNITTRVCEGADWFRLANLTVGEGYSFEFTDIDPGYYEYSLSPGEVTTGSTTYVTAGNTSFIPDRTGDYIILVSYQQRGDVTNANIAARFLLNDTVIGETVRRIRSVDPSFHYPSFTMWDRRTLNANTSYNLTLQHLGIANQDSFIKNINFHVFNAETYDINQYNYTNLTADNLLTATPATILNTSIVPDITPGQWLDIAYLEGQYQDNNELFYTTFFSDNTNHSNWFWEPTDTGADQWWPAAYMRGDNRSTTGNIGFQSWANSLINPSYTRRARAASIYFTPEEDFQYWQNDTTTTNDQTTYVNHHNISWSPEYPNSEYAIFFQGEVSSITRNAPIIQVTVNGTEICAVPTQTREPEERLLVNCNTVLNVSTTDPIEILVNIRTAQNNQQVEARESHVVAFRTNPNKNDLLCYPVPNQLWVIDEPVICDNVTRSTGTGSTLITTGGSLELLNNAQITTNGLQLVRWANPFLAKLERGSNIYVTR